MKRSKTISLVILGTTALIAGCDEGPTEQQLMQNKYASHAECAADWGQDCNAHGSSGGGSHFYTGPNYYWNHAQGHPVAVYPDGSTRPVVTGRFAATGSSTGTASATGSSVSVARGGFGSSAHASSSGG